MRTQYRHAIGLVPTVLDCLGTTPPATIGGVTHAPIEGGTFAHTFENGETPTRRHTQYFEMMGHRSVPPLALLPPAPPLPPPALLPPLPPVPSVELEPAQATTVAIERATLTARAMTLDYSMVSQDSVDRPLGQPRQTRGVERVRPLRARTPAVMTGAGSASRCRSTRPTGPTRARRTCWASFASTTRRETSASEPARRIRLPR